jgi:hypothetical protein
VTTRASFIASPRSTARNPRGRAPPRREDRARVLPRRRLRRVRRGRARDGAAAAAPSARNLEAVRRGVCRHLEPPVRIGPRVVYGSATSTARGRCPTARPASSRSSWARYATAARRRSSATACRRTTTCTSATSAMPWCARSTTTAALQRRHRRRDLGRRPLVRNPRRVRHRPRGRVRPRPPRRAAAQRPRRLPHLHGGNTGFDKTLWRARTKLARTKSQLRLPAVGSSLTFLAGGCPTRSLLARAYLPAVASVCRIHLWTCGESSRTRTSLLAQSRPPSLATATRSGLPRSVAYVPAPESP